jgi:hypothetical protein
LFRLDRRCGDGEKFSHAHVAPPLRRITEGL